MMLTQQLRDPRVLSGPMVVTLESALRRALEAAREPAGAPRREPWWIYSLEAEAAASLAWMAARRLEGDVGPQGARAAYEQWRAVPGWAVVTCLRSDDAEQFERDREAALSAAQRASLSLWSDSVPSNWLPDLIADEPAFFELIGADSTRETPVGVLLYGHPER